MTQLEIIHRDVSKLLARPFHMPAAPLLIHSLMVMSHLINARRGLTCDVFDKGLQRLDVFIQDIHIRQDY